MKPIPDKLNKITPGCLAIVTGKTIIKENVGKIVTCIKFIGPLPDFPHFDYWEVDKPLLFGSYLGPRIEANLCPESVLTPISGDQLLDEEEKEQVRDLYRVRFTSGDMTCK